jgi:hypothetical protein
VAEVLVALVPELPVLRLVVLHSPATETNKYRSSQTPQSRTDQ